MNQKNQVKQKRQIYKPTDLTIIIPTKDRPEKIKNILTSLQNQTKKCGRIIIVNGGESIKDIVYSFSTKLPVEYYECRPPGQIRQRNFGISHLNKKNLLVACFDDDIVLMPDAIEEMISFWNTCDTDTAGISFNIVNDVRNMHKYSWIRGIMGLSAREQGRILKSGRNTSILSVPENIRSQWLCGGATVWKQEIIKKHTLNEINSKCAVCEDLVFSYPLGKKYPLYICAGAKVMHEHIYNNAKTDFKYFGKAETLWRLYFVESNSDLSRLYFFWNLAAMIIARMILGIFTFQKRHILYGIGQMQGAYISIITLLKGADLLVYLNDYDDGNKKSAQ